MDPKEAARICSQAAGTLLQAMTKTTDVSQLSELAQGLWAVITRVDRPELSRQAAAVAAGIGPLAGIYVPGGAKASLFPALKPLPSRLSTRALVELLKQPSCVGWARRVILNQLEYRYRQKFADHWAFVRFAQKQKLDLDFSTPPKRLMLPTVGEKK
jgi:hypothetical protein